MTIIYERCLHCGQVTTEKYINDGDDWVEEIKVNVGSCCIDSPSYYDQE